MTRCVASWGWSPGSTVSATSDSPSRRSAPDGGRSPSRCVSCSRRMYPQILVQLADGELVAGRLDDHRDTVGQARSLIDRYPHAAAPAARMEVLAAELSLRVDALDGCESDVEVAALLAEPVLPRIARARLLGGLGRASAQAGTATALRRGTRLRERSAQLFAQVGAATWGNLPLGRYRVALEQLDRALRLTRNDPRARLAVLPHRAFVLIDLGRYAQAESDLAELRCSAYAEDPFGNERSAVRSRWGPPGSPRSGAKRRRRGPPAMRWRWRPSWSRPTGAMVGARRARCGASRTTSPWSPVTAGTGCRPLGQRRGAHPARRRAGRGVRGPAGRARRDHHPASRSNRRAAGVPGAARAVRHRPPRRGRAVARQRSAPRCSGGGGTRSTCVMTCVWTSRSSSR